jgi:hypothetical protein
MAKFDLDAYKKQAKEKVELVDVIPEPGGFVYQFQKPSKFQLLFEMGTLPQTTISKALQGWQQTAETGQVAPETEKEQQLLLDKTLAIRNKVLELSHFPKLVVGPAQNEDELSTDDVPDSHLEYFFKWVSSGGDESRMLSMFSQPGKAGLTNGNYRKKQRMSGK